MPKKPLLSLLSSLPERLAGMRFLSFSLLLHVVIVLLAGSVVIFKHLAEAPDFTAGDGEIISSAEAAAAPPEDQSLQTPPMQVTAPQVASASLDAITTNAVVNPAFQLTASPVMAKLDSKLANMPDGGKGLADKMAGLSGGGMKGGTGRFFGMKENKDNRSGALVGTFYDAKQTHDRKPTNVDVNAFSAIVTRFVEGGWKSSSLREYYRAPSLLYTTQIFIPNMPADEGPRAFEVEKEVQPSRWLVHYHGKVSPPRDGDFRFVGAGDDYLVVKFNGKLVLDHGFAKATKWQPEQYYNYGFTGVPQGFAQGDKFHASSGQYYDLDILVSERPGGLVFFCLMLEDQSVNYEKDGKGNPILPIFRLADMPLPELKPGQTLPPYLAQGPIWRSAPATTAQR